LRLSALIVVLCAALSGAGLLARGGAQESKKEMARPAAAEKAAPGSLVAGKQRHLGRVVLPDSKPAVGARVYLVRMHRDEQNRLRRNPTPAVVAGPDGSFELVAPAAEPRDIVVLMAVVKGYGPAWAEVGRGKDDKHVTLKLAPDDVPIEGRVVDLEGNPIAGVTVRVRRVSANQEENLGAWLERARKSLEVWGDGVPYNRIDVVTAGLAHPTRTDEHGRFRLDGFGRERMVTLLFEGPTIETRPVDVITRRGEKPLTLYAQKNQPYFGTVTIYPARFDFAAAPTRVVEGVVRSADTGKPLAGVTVKARMTAGRGYDIDEDFQAKTDAEGRYRLVGLPRGLGQTIRVEPALSTGYLPAGQRTPAAEKLAPARLDFTLLRGVVIRGKATDKVTGKPVRVKMEYFVFDSNPYLKKSGGFRFSEMPRIMTAEDGSFTLLGLPGPGVVVATEPDRRSFRYLTAVGTVRKKGMTEEDRYITHPYILNPHTHNTLVEIDPPEGRREMTCDVQLDPGATVKGTIIGPDGKPVEGVQIKPSWGRNPGSWDVLKSADFTLTTIDLASPRPYFFQHHGRKLGAVVLFKPDQTDKVVVKLQPHGVIKGRLLDLEGEPVAKMILMGMFEDGQLGVERGWGGIFHAVTDEEGRFTIHVHPGIRLGAYLSPSPARLGERLFKDLTLKPGEVKDLGDVRRSTSAN
jgi:hypothetical protein